MGRAAVLRTIRDAEADAEATLEKAEKDAADLITKARVESAESLSKGKQDSDTEGNGILEKSKAVAEKDASAVSSDGDSQLASVHESGESNRAEAIEAVLSAFRQS